MAALKPKVRLLDHRWVEEDGESYLALWDPTGVSEHIVAVSPAAAYVLSLCNGKRTLEELAVSVHEKDIDIQDGSLQSLIDRMQEAFLLDGPEFEKLARERKDEFHKLSHRVPAHAGTVYPTSSDELTMMLDGYRPSVEVSSTIEKNTNNVCAILSPHIDFHRGGHIYSGLWRSVEDAVKSADIVVIFGTDHHGQQDSITLTEQSYATPYGVLPTDKDVVASLSKVIGTDEAFQSELNHIQEHSIELVSVWLHYIREGKPCNLVPILCGPFHFEYAEEGELFSVPGKAKLFAAALAKALKGKNYLLVAAGDLAHVGPNFGDTQKFDKTTERELVKQVDSEYLQALCHGQSQELLRFCEGPYIWRKVCGYSSIMHMVLTLESLTKGVEGFVTGYDQCRADEEDTSLVSIAGVAFQKR